MFFLHVCTCTTGVPGVLGGQKKALDLLELELGLEGSVALCTIPALARDNGELSSVHWESNLVL